MKYSQLDRIIEVDPGKRLVAQRTLRAEEEYLKDHFPQFPVMPGVMMLEALYQAAAWLVRVSNDFKPPLVLLQEAKSVKFGDFLIPGETLTVVAEITKTEGDTVHVKARAEKNGKISVMARLVLQQRSTGLADRLDSDAIQCRSIQNQFETLFGPLESFLPANSH